MTSDAFLADLNGIVEDPPDQRLSALRAQATRLVEEVAGPLKHVALRDGDCAVELTWADPVPEVAGAPTVPVTVSDTASDTVLDSAPDEADLCTVVAPLVGVYYAAAAPGAQPFVRPGDYVSVNQSVGIIEAMKLMNEITTGTAGIVTAVLVTNGEQVEFGQELVRIRPGPEIEI
jgi:acetyl-CoA carboxylase biotin carboxyl carrier protein